MQSTANTVSHISAGPNSIKLAEFDLRQFQHIPDAGVPFEAMLQPEYWRNVAQNHLVRDFIYVVPPENNYTALLMVRGVQKLALKIGVVWRTAFDEVIVEPEAGITVMFRGPKALWSVMRGKEVLAEHMTTREEANAERDRLLNEQKAA
jgi:hypothetical protein